MPSIVNDVEGPNESSGSKGRLAATATLCTPGSAASPACTRSANSFTGASYVVFLAGQGDIEHHEVIGPEARVHVGQTLEAADQEPGPHQQHGAQRELREDENGSRAPTARRCRHPCPSGACVRCPSRRHGAPARGRRPDLWRRQARPKMRARGHRRRHPASRGRASIRPAVSTCTTSTAITVPSTAPPKAMSMLSASDWPRSCRRPAPRAVRTATSEAREAARTSSRLATFAQAISSTNITAPSIAQSGASTSPTICCRSGTASHADACVVLGERLGDAARDRVQIALCAGERDAVAEPRDRCCISDCRGQCRRSPSLPRPRGTRVRRCRES